MPLPAYPIARDGHDALIQLRAGATRRAMRERDAEAMAGGRVAFVSEATGPVYERREDALDAYAGLVEDDRSGRLFSPAPENAVCVLTCRLKSPVARGRAVTPVFRDGERWPKMARPAEPVWQLSVSYWKMLGASAAKAGTATGDQARKLRKSARGGELTPDEVQGLADTPLVPLRPQKQLDYGLFDFIPPDNPGIVIADE
jgi:hypothetical protein